MSLTQYSAFSRLLTVFKNSLPALQLPFTNRLNYEGQSLRRNSINANKQEEVKDFSKIDKEMSEEIFAKVNDQIDKKTHGRLFAVVYIAGLQYKITTEDIVVIRQHWPPTAGDKIRLEKVLLVGSSDFTLIGRPLLPLDQVTVLATVIEKTLTHPYPNFRFKPRKNFMKLTFQKDELTYLRITNISLRRVNELSDTDGLQDRIF